MAYGLGYLISKASDEEDKTIDDKRKIIALGLGVLFLFAVILIKNGEAEVWKKSYIYQSQIMDDWYLQMCKNNITPEVNDKNLSCSTSLVMG